MSTVLPPCSDGRAGTAAPTAGGGADQAPATRTWLPWRKAAFYVCLVVLGVMLLASCALCSVLALLVPRRRRRDCGRAIISLCARSFFRLACRLDLVRLDLSALDALNAERGLIIAPNHPSMLDALLVVSRVRRTGCIMKAELWDSPFLGAGARLAGYIRNDSAHSMIRQAATDLRAGDKLLIFPEGTRTTRFPVNPLCSGIALIAQRAEVPIQTVLIETDSPYLGKHWPLFKLPELPLCYRATLGPRWVVGADRRRTLAQMQDWYEQALGSTTSVQAAHRFGTA